MPSCITSEMEAQFLRLVAFNKEHSKPELPKFQFIHQLLEWEINLVFKREKLVSFHCIDATSPELIEWIGAVCEDVKHFIDSECYPISEIQSVHTIFYDKQSELSCLARELLIWTLACRYQTRKLSPMGSWVLLGIIAGYSMPDINKWITDNGDAGAWEIILATLPISLHPER